MELWNEVWKQIQDVKEDELTGDVLNEWISKLAEDNQYHYLEGKTYSSIHLEKVNHIQPLSTKEITTKWLESLRMYRLIYTLQDLRLGRHIRWLRKKEGNYTLTNGGILLQIKFLEKGTYLVCKNGIKIMQYLLDDCVTFQKITAEEWVLLVANENGNDGTING